MDAATRMMELLGGFAGAYGTYESEVRNEAKNKLEIKASARTIREPVTVQLWQRHLNGTFRLGVIPVREDATCSWGVIDIDRYDVSHTDLLALLDRHKLPMLVVRSKSGGAHLYMFLQEPTPAGAVIAKLREVAAAIGYGASEVFPKQAHILVEKGDLGTWLNMPYMGGDESDRHAVKPGGMAMTLEEFIRAAEKARCALSDIEVSPARAGNGRANGLLQDGPPCLQFLSSTGFPEGTRNSGLLALGVFAKKAHPDTWERVLDEMNQKYMVPPLSAEEVSIVTKSLRKKDYNYRCKDQPLLSHCNSAVCRTRKHGVGGEDDFPTISGLSVLATDPPLWFLDIDGERIEMSTDQLQNYKMFHKVCMERLMKCFQSMGQAAWLRVVAEVMQHAVKIDAPVEVSTTGQFHELLEDWLMNRHRGTSRDDLLTGRPWEDDDTKRHYFRLRDLQGHLEKNGFKTFSRGQLATRIRNMGGGDMFMNIKGNGRGVWYLPLGIFQRLPQAPTPPAPREPM